MAVLRSRIKGIPVDMDILDLMRAFRWKTAQPEAQYLSGALLRHATEVAVLGSSRLDLEHRAAIVGGDGLSMELSVDRKQTRCRTPDVGDVGGSVKVQSRKGVRGLADGDNFAGEAELVDKQPEFGRQGHETRWVRGHGLSVVMRFRGFMGGVPIALRVV